MKSLSDTLTEVKKTLDLPHPDPASDLKRLQGLQPTAVIEKALDGQRMALEAAERDGLGQAVVNAGHRIAVLEARLSLARIRDEIQATRPEGCWCLGLGGRIRAAIGPLPDEPFETWREFCGCPDGQRQQDEAAEYADLSRSWVVQRRLERLWSQAAVPVRYQQFGWRSYLAVCDPQNRPVVQRLYRWIERDRWLYLSGPVGTGKTGLVCVLARSLIEQGRSVLFATAPDLLQRLRDSYDRREASTDSQLKQTWLTVEGELLGALEAADVLILDDLGAERPTAWSIERLTAVLNRRYNARRRTAITSNYGPGELAERLGERALSRVLENADVLQLVGRDLRAKSTPGGNAS